MIELEGVRILSVATEMPDLALCIYISFLAVVACFCLCLMASSGWQQGIVIAITLFIIFINVSIGMQDTQTIMKATITPTVSLTEFNEKYEIISQEDDLYTIKERRK